jgi:hypothetical protein
MNSCTPVRTPADIVERLRQVAAYGLGNFGFAATVALTLEAADEIERLTAALRAIAIAETVSDEAEILQDIARAALEGKP